MLISYILFGFYCCCCLPVRVRPGNKLFWKADVISCWRLIMQLMKELRSQRKNAEATQRLAIAKERVTTTPSREGQREIWLSLEPRGWSHPAEVLATSSLCRERWGHRQIELQVNMLSEVERTWRNTLILAFPPPSNFQTVPPFGQTQPEARGYKRVGNTACRSDRAKERKGCERGWGNQAQHWMTSLLETWQCPCPKAFSTKCSSLLQKTRLCTLALAPACFSRAPFYQLYQPLLPHTQLTFPSWLLICTFQTC